MRELDFERLYADHAERLYAFLVYRGSDRAQAEDLLSETFERAFRARDRYDEARGSGSAWLYSIAINLMRDQARRAVAESRALERVPPAPPDRSETFEEETERRDELGRALAELSAEEREAIALRYGADLSLKQIAEVLAEPMTTVEGRVYRGLRRLRSSLDNE